MAILKASMHKSGNLWLSRILRSITRRAGWEYTTWVQRQRIHATALTWQLSYSGQADMDFMSILPDGCYWRISDVYRERLENVEEYVHACSHVWCHSPIIPRSLEVLPLFDKIVYLIRDPRDIAVSLSRFVFTPHVGELRQRRPSFCPGSEETLEGFVAAAGPDIGGRGGVGDIAPVDVAPTLLALLGISAPPDMPSRPHASLLDAARPSQIQR